MIILTFQIFQKGFFQMFLMLLLEEEEIIHPGGSISK